MAPPSEDEVLRFINELIDQKTPDGEHTAFEWDFLLDSTRRYFRSTTPAIAQRMKSLITRGDLAKIKVTHSGYVYLTDELSSGMWTLYFRYKPTGYDHWGTLSAKRDGDIENLWANGNRYLFTTKWRFEAMVTHFTEVRADHYARLKLRNQEKDARFWELAATCDPDARQLLDRLEKAVPGIDVSTCLSERSGVERMYISLDARTNDQVSALLAVLRRGLFAP
jgi:hypothetical protein